MRATKRKHEPAVIALLLAEPYRFSFIQLVSLLLCQLQRQGISRERALHSVLSFRNSLSLSFPASEVEALDLEPATQDPLGALRAGTGEHHVPDGRESDHPALGHATIKRVFVAASTRPRTKKEHAVLILQGVRKTAYLSLTKMVQRDKV